MIRKRKKILKIILIIIIISIITTIIINIVRNKTRKNNETIYEIAEIDYNYFLLNIDEKYGVIDTKGNIIIQPIFDKVVIPNPKFSVFICSNNEDEKNIVLNENNEKIYSIYDNVEPIAINGILTSLPYEKDVLKYKVNNQYGLINLDGTRITKAIYDEIDGLTYKEGELIVKQKGKFGVINTKGKKTINFEYDSIEADRFYNKEIGYTLSGYIVSNITEEGYRYGYITSEGKKLLDVEYNNIKRISAIEDTNNIYLIASNNGQYGLLKNGTQIIDFKYQGIEYNDLNNLLIINKANKYGVYTLKGEEIIPIEYKTLLFNGVYVYAKNGDDIKYFTNKGEDVTTGFTSLKPIEDGKYYISIDTYGLHGIIDSNNNTLVENKYIYIDYLFNEYFSAYKNDNGLGVINANGNILTDFKYTILNRIGETKLIEAEDMSNNIIYIYNDKLEIISQLKNSELDIRDTYIKLHNEDTNIYIDLEGNIITENDAITSSKESPDQIGKYVKEYYGYSQVYYTVNKELEESD